MKISTTRRGLTLIELTVVLLILAATAGILVPRLVGYSGRAHGAAGASNVQEISKAISLFETNNGRLPNNWDSLMDNTGTLATYLSGGTPFQATTFLSVEEAGALNSIGITQLNTMALPTAAGFNATFSPNDGANTSAVAAATDPIVIVADAATIPGAGLATGARVVALGLGQGSEMIGTVMTDAPVHFPEGGAKPEDFYLRYYALFLTDADGVAGGEEERARFIGVFAVEPDSGEFSGVAGHLGEYYENRDR